MSEETPELSIVLPCLNEAETLGICVEKARGFLDRAKIAGEVVVGDNGSTDGSPEIAARLGARVVPVPLRGYGSAVAGAVRESRGRYIIMADADDSYDLSDLLPFLQRLRAGDDLVMGNRFRGTIQPGAMPWKNRYIGNPALSRIGKLFFGVPIHDFHCGIRGFSRRAFDEMDLRTAGMEFASEMVIKATLLGMRLSEVPATLKPDGRSRAPHLRPWSDGWRHLRFMLCYSPSWLFLYPGIVLMLFGLALGAVLVAEPVQVGRVELDVHTLLFCGIFVLAGAQSVLFWICAHTFVLREGLLPKPADVRERNPNLTLEHGMPVGLALVLAGILGSAFALYRWNEAGFGNLLPRETLRSVIPSATALALGIQVILATFFYGMITLRFSPRRKP